jgi:hypothetical protein
MILKFSLEWVVKYYLDFLMKFGIDEKELTKRYYEFHSAKIQLNNKDFIWYIFQNLLLENSNIIKSETEFYRNLRDIYFQMVYFRRKHEKTKANEILQLAFEAELKINENESRLDLEVVIISGHCCDYCDSLNNKKFTLKEVFDKKFLGSENCKNERGCNCCYALIAKQDENGFAIIK